MSHKMFGLILSITLLANLIGIFPAPVVLAAEPAPTATDTPYAADHLIVKLREEARVEKGTMSTHIVSLDKALAEMKAVALEAVPGLPATYLVKLSSKNTDILSAVETLNNDPAVEYAEPDYLAKFASAPDDPRYSEQWGLTKVQAEDAWDQTMGSPGVVIAIIDSGIDLTHEDLSPNLWVNPGEIAGNGLDDDNNGFVDDVQGWNFVDTNNNVMDMNGHGSLVAGIAAARSNNTLGIAGVCGNCRIMPVKITQVSGFANYSDIAAGIYYSIDKGAKVINLSVGGYSDSITVKNAVNTALSQNIVVVGGVGNDDKSDKFYPAAYEGVIAVAGTAENDVRVTTSNYGSWVDVSAPGQNILSTTLGDYSSDTGTSYATPFVSGAAGLLLSLHPEWTPAMVRSQFMHTADGIDSLNPGYEGMLGAGRLNAALATQPANPMLIYKTYSGNGTPGLRPDFGSTVSLAVTLYNDWADATGVTGTLSSTDSYVTITTAEADFGTIQAGASQANPIPFSFNIATGAGYNHAMPFTLALSANDGSYTTTVNFTITTRSSEEPVSGTIFGDTTWTNDKTYIVTNNVGIAQTATLTIQEGTTVKFNGDFALNVGGKLIADGSEEQPIRFISNNEASWNRIYFDNPGVDAVADENGNYQDGNILRWVEVDGATNGIVCNNSTPFLSHITLSEGGLNCALGEQSLWLTDSNLTGEIVVNGTAPVTGKWVGRTPLSSGRNSAAVATVDNLLYAIGGSTGNPAMIDVNTVERYDPVQNTWQARANLPVARSGAAAVTVGGEIYLLGGRQQETQVYKYNPQADSWQMVTNLPVGTSFPGAVALDGKIYVIGGQTAEFDKTLVQIYDPAGNTWDSGSEMPTGRMDLAVTAVDGKIYALGGNPGYPDDNSPFEIYDPVIDSWQQMPDLPGWCDEGASALVNNKIYLVCKNQVTYEYTLATSEWRTIAPFGHFSYGRVGAGMVGNRFFVISQDYSQQNYNEELLLPAGLWNVIIDNSRITGNLTTGSSVKLMNSQVNGDVTLDSGEITSNVISGNLSLFVSGMVEGNHVIGGNITAYSSTIHGNRVENAPGWAVRAYSSDVISANRVTHCANGIEVWGVDGVLSGNLIANNGGIGMRINTNSEITSNTFTGNSSSAIVLVDGTEISIQDNNFEFNSGTYDIENLVPISNLPQVAASGNWWGTTDTSEINQRIFDINDEYYYGQVVYEPVLTGPSPVAPAYVRSVTLDPASPVGIQTVNYTVEFSRPMDVDNDPEISFRSTLHNTWTVYNTDNSGLPNLGVYDFAIDLDGSKWFSTYEGVAHYDGTTWVVYNIGNSGLPNNIVMSIAVDGDGSKWFGTWGGGVAHFDGTTWTIYNTSNSGLTSNYVVDIAVDKDGSKWFSIPNAGVVNFDGATWTVYNTGNSGLQDDYVNSIAIDLDGTKWFGTQFEGVVRFDGTTWSWYNQYDYGLLTNMVNVIIIDIDGSKWIGTACGVGHFDDTTWNSFGLSDVSSIAIDPDGSKWFGTDEGVVNFDGTNLTVYNTGNSGLPNQYVRAIDVDNTGSIWVGTYGGIGVLWEKPAYLFQSDFSWLDETHFQASYEVNALIERGDYVLTVSDAVGGDGMTIVPDSRTTFTVDYAGEISDTTPPAAPAVIAWGNGSLTQLSAKAFASDPDSEIVGYRYAIGTTPGGSDVVNWTNTPYAEITRTGLLLQSDQAYYVSFQARNLSGLWSVPGVSNGVVNGAELNFVYLPAIRR